VVEAARANQDQHRQFRRRRWIRPHGKPAISGEVSTDSSAPKSGQQRGSVHRPQRDVAPGTCQFERVQVPFHPESRLFAQIGAAAGVAVERAGLGRAPRARISWTRWLRHASSFSTISKKVRSFRTECRCSLAAASAMPVTGLHTKIGRTSLSSIAPTPGSLAAPPHRCVHQERSR
jgi:hypothetical protein